MERIHETGAGGRRRQKGGRGVRVALLGLAAASLAACEGKPESQASVRVTKDLPHTTTEPVLAKPPAEDSSVRVVAALPAEGGKDASGAAVKPTPPAQHVTYGEAERVFRSGDYAKAAELFEAYAARVPENPWGSYMVGISAWRAGDHKGAESALRRTIEVDPKHTKGLLNLARVLLEQRKAADAMDFARVVVELQPESGEGWRVLGNARAELGMVDGAVDAYRQAIVLNDKDAWTMNNLGLLMIQDGRHEAALRPLARATELEPKVAVFQNNLGVALERSGYHAQAAEAFRAALAANAGYARARVSLERVEARTDDSTLVPLELTGLAAGFADEVARWKVDGVPVEDDHSKEVVGKSGRGG